MIRVINLTLKTKKCSKCGQTKSLDEFHKDKRNKIDGHQLQCKKCKSEYSRKKYLQSHPNARKHLFSEPNGLPKSLKLCRNCKTAKPRSEFHRQESAKDGLRSICKECRRKRQQQYERVAIKEERYKCKICGKKFTRLNKLKIHNRIHTGEKPYKCKYCDMRFSDSTNLKVHKRTHTGEKPYQCKFCGQKFSQINHKKAHERIHTGERPYICKICGGTFTRRHHLTAHKRIHTDEKPFICKECGEAFRQNIHLKRHLKKHSGEDLFICEECETSFLDSSSLKRHMRIHTGEKPYQCDECGKRFSLQSNFKRHIDINACWFTRITEIQWEELCYEIAQLLFKNKLWEWHPRVETSRIKEKEWITPDIRIEESDGTIEFIDVKRSTYSPKHKDLVIYPQKAKKVTFWCLFGKKHKHKSSRIYYVKSSELITQLETIKDSETESKIDKLILKINLLQKGEDITKFSKSNTLDKWID